ncbi:hypothetical protein ACFYNO_11340 [Kitasatospora sp. NPDC006697]|uniref:hypothetical protein n=1 Tax=Kitasatospora sp. NPDC006697 TaxID=3364020 RepID=UPI0036C67468
MRLGRALPTLGVSLLTLLALSAPAAVATPATTIHPSTTTHPATTTSPAAGRAVTAAAPRGHRAPGATLQGASVSFHSDHDQKDRDTSVTVIVRDIDGNTAARISSTFGLFEAYSDDGPFQLAILNHTPGELLRGGQTTLRIDPHGHNHWEPNLYVDLVFSDGSHLSTDCAGLDLDQESRQVACGIS